MRVVGSVRKSYLGPGKIASISSRNLSRSSKHDTFWRVVSTGYFYNSFSWANAVSNFLLLEIYKNLGLPLPSNTFKVNSHADNLFYKYICFKYYTVWNHFQRFFRWTLKCQPANCLSVLLTIVVLAPKGLSLFAFNIKWTKWR